MKGSTDIPYDYPFRWNENITFSLIIYEHEGNKTTSLFQQHVDVLWHNKLWYYLIIKYLSEKKLYKKN